MKQQGLFGAVLAGLMVVSVALVGAQTKDAAKKPTSLGSVTIGKNVTADGKALAKGTYMLRVSDEMPAAVVGQSADEARWVEFLQGGTVKGREMATVLSKDALKAMAKKGSSAAPETVKVEELQGGDNILRVWVNRGGVQYLIHLSIAK
ncbi:MAG: hypothetical protein WCQ64_09825 [Acidobacteriota bacterium]